MGASQPEERQFDEGLKESLDPFYRELAELARGVRCPVHDEPPTSIEFKGTSVKDVGADIEGCCDRLRGAVLETIQTRIATAAEGTP